MIKQRKLWFAVGILFLRKHWKKEHPDNKENQNDDKEFEEPLVGVSALVLCKYILNQILYSVIFSYSSPF